MPAYTLPDLPYDYGSLEPHISGKIMELHHAKHHDAIWSLRNWDDVADRFDAADIHSRSRGFDRPDVSPRSKQTIGRQGAGSPTL